jgi:hypothetical protein
MGFTVTATPGNAAGTAAMAAGTVIAAFPAAVLALVTAGSALLMVASVEMAVLAAATADAADNAITQPEDKVVDESRERCSDYVRLGGMRH